MKTTFTILVLVASIGVAEATNPMPPKGWCVATFNRDVPVPKLVSCSSPSSCKWEMRPSPYTRVGVQFPITGGSPDPEKVCQHGGDCVPRSSLNIPANRKRVGSHDGYGPYYGWERR